MDKKQNSYFRQGSNKALVSEPRKSSDVFSTKPRNPRRRETPNFSNSKTDPQRSKPPKTRPNVDKRPRPRGSNASCAFGVPAAGSGLADVDPATAVDGQNDFDVELNSVYLPGSKKQNLNHLLNFHYGPRECDYSSGLNVFGRNGSRGYAKKHKYNKEQFLQANFQFVIKADAEDNIIASSQDTLVDWSLIEQINIQTTEEPQCPVCLYPPIAAKLTRCGHVYCWPCILHYLALTDKTWRKCPICYEAVHLADLKSTAIVQQINFNVGDTVSLQLMRRKKGSMFIEKLGTAEHNGKIPHITANDNQTKFSKFLLATKKEILTILERERSELVSGEDSECPEFIFYQQALDLLKERKTSVFNEIGMTEDQLLEETNKNYLTSIPEENNEKSENEENSEVGSDKSPETSEKNFDSQVNCSTGAIQKDGAKFYYFYQSVDGQNIFLHPLNVKMLQAMYGTLDRGPAVIDAKILQKEHQSMDEDHRKKFTCLGHLPLTCQFAIVEVQLESPVISDEVLKMFKDDIMQRHKNRNRRAREEKKREKEINLINERQMGKLIARSANIDIKSSQQFPIFGIDDGLNRNSFGDGFSPYASELADSPPPVLPSPSNFTSFANVLSSPKKELWPTLDKNTCAEGTSEIVWGKSISSAIQNLSETDNVNVDTNRGDAAHYARQNFADVIAEALQHKKLVDADVTARGSNKKNKKNKKTLLFSTGINFSGNI